jgi:hypothetical protein
MHLLTIFLVLLYLCIGCVVGDVALERIPAKSLSERLFNLAVFAAIGPFVAVLSVLYRLVRKL